MLNEHRGGDLKEWISDGDEIIVDFVGRYENLNEDWSKICQTLQVPALPLGRENQVVRQHYRVFYDDELRELVANRFAARLSYSTIASVASRSLETLILAFSSREKEPLSHAM
jgi:hypothetical protein